MSRVYINRCADIRGRFRHKPYTSWTPTLTIGIKHYYRDYVLEVETYDVFQVLYVKKGCVSLQTQEGNVNILPGRAALLRLNSNYTAASPQGESWCVHFTAQGVERDDYYGTALALEADTTLQTVAELLYRHLDGDENLRPDLVASLGKALAAEAIYLGRASECTPASEVDDYEARQAKEALDATIRSGMGAREVLAGSRYSYRQVARLFKEAYGISPKQYQLSVRWEEAKRLLSHSDLPITTVALELGFSSSQYFAQQFKAHSGMSPSAYREHRQ